MWYTHVSVVFGIVACQILVALQSVPFIAVLHVIAGDSVTTFTLFNRVLLLHEDQNFLPSLLSHCWLSMRVMHDACKNATVAI